MLRVPTEIVPFTPDHLDLVARFSEAAWRRPRSAAYLRWRYLDPPFHQALLALRDGRCLAMLSTFRRPYASGDEVVHVCDSFDWYTLPELRRSGLGVRLMQHLMKGPDPVIVTGGTPDTRDFLPRMGFWSLATVRRYVLPLTSHLPMQALARRGVPRWAGEAALRVTRPWWAPRRRDAPSDARVLPVAHVGAEARGIDPRPRGEGCAPIWTDAHLHWLEVAYPGMGHYLPLYFVVGERLVGWALLRFYGADSGLEARLLDIRAAEADAGLYPWMVSEVATRAAGLGARSLATGTTCPAVERALLRNRFRPWSTAPIHFFSSDRASLGEPVVFTAHWGDEVVVPYPSGWWEPDTGPLRRLPPLEAGTPPDLSDPPSAGA